jgi:hypothetical protein
VDRLRAAGLNNAADAMSQSLQHFKDELAGRAPSLIGGPELDAVGVYNAGNAEVDVHFTDRPIVLALSGYETVNWTLKVDENATLQRVIVSGYDAALRPAGVPANVPVDLYSYPQPGQNLFYLFGKYNSDYAYGLQTLYRLTGLPPTSVQPASVNSGTPFSIGQGGAEWAADRVLFEMQPLYREATAFQIAQDRAAARQYRFTGLYTTYSPQGFSQGTHVAQMTPLGAIDGTILPALVNYKFIAVDPRGPTYYAFKSSDTVPVRFDPVTKQETSLPALASSILGRAWGMSFDTKHNRLVLGNSGGAYYGDGFLYYYPDEGIWLRAALANQQLYIPFSLTYSSAGDAYFALEAGPLGALRLDRFDATGLFTGRTDLSQFIACSAQTCQLAAAGDRLVLMVPPSMDIAEPFLPPVPHSFLIDPTNGNVTILGALPEPGGMMVLAAIGILLSRRRRRT